MQPDYPMGLRLGQYFQPALRQSLGANCDFSGRPLAAATLSLQASPAPRKLSQPCNMEPIKDSKYKVQVQVKVGTTLGALLRHSLHALRRFSIFFFFFVEFPILLLAHLGGVRLIPVGGSIWDATFTKFNPWTGSAGCCLFLYGDFRAVS